MCWFQIRVAAQGRHDGDHELGRRCAHGHDRKTHDDRAHPERGREPRTATDEPIGPEIKDAETPEEEQDVLRHALVPLRRSSQPCICFSVIVFSTSPLFNQARLA